MHQGRSHISVAVSGSRAFAYQLCVMLWLGSISGSGSTTASASACSCHMQVGELVSSTPGQTERRSLDFRLHARPDAILDLAPALHEAGHEVEGRYVFTNTSPEHGRKAPELWQSYGRKPAASLHARLHCARARGHLAEDRHGCTALWLTLQLNPTYVLQCSFTSLANLRLLAVACGSPPRQRACGELVPAAWRRLWP